MLFVKSLEKGDVLPTLCLPEVEGGFVCTVKYRGRANLVLLFSHPIGCFACASLMKSFQDNLKRFHDDKSEILAIVPGSYKDVFALKQQFGLSFPVLVSATRLSCTEATIMVTDRFGTIFAKIRGGNDHHFPTVDQLCMDLAVIDIQCQE